MRKEYRRFILVLVALLCVSSVVQADNPAVRLAVSVDANGFPELAGELDVVTRTVVTDELDWRFLFSAEADERLVIDISDMVRDDKTFEGDQLYTLVLTIAGKAHRLAFLVAPGQSFGAIYARELRSLLHQNTASLFPSSATVSVTHALPSGYWVVSDNPELRAGKWGWIMDMAGRRVALVTVSDQFSYVPESAAAVPVVELLPIWAGEPIVAGMPLDPNGADTAISCAMTFSLERIGASVSVGLPLPGSLFRFSLEGDATVRWEGFPIDVLFLGGLSRQFSFGELNRSPDRLGAWWTNLQVKADVQLGAGFTYETHETVAMIYGAVAELSLLHQSASRWYWGIGIGYRYLARVGPVAISGVQGNERGITLSPTFGWIW